MVAANGKSIDRICASQYSGSLDWDWATSVWLVAGAVDWADFWLVAKRGLDGLTSTVIRVAIAADSRSYSVP